MQTLDEFSAEINRQIELARTIPQAPVDQFGDGSFFWPQSFDSRQRLRSLSVEIRRRLWNDRAGALALAKKADDAATEIESRCADMLPTSPEARFPASYQDCSGWARAVQ